MTLRVVLEALRWGLGPLLLCRLERLGSDRAPVERDIALIVPARDEAARIAPLLESLVALDPQPAEVVVVDDDSTDATADLARAAGVRVVRCPPRPDGWNGKQWACHTGQAATAADVLCFVDADVVLAPDALGLVGAALDRHRGLVSVQPHHLTGSVVEGLSLLANLVSMMGTDAFGPVRGRVPPSGAFGPVLACARQDHVAVGGHNIVRSSLMEDVALALAYRRAGLPVTLFAGGATVGFRMHEGTVSSVFRGWTRGLGDGARRVRLLTLLLIAVWLSGIASAPLLLFDEPAVGAVVCAAYAAQLWWLGRRIGRFPWTAWSMFPISFAFFLVVFLWSVLVTILGHPVGWKGRRLRPTKGR